MQPAPLPRGEMTPTWRAARARQLPRQRGSAGAASTPRGAGPGCSCFQVASLLRGGLRERLPGEATLENGHQEQVPRAAVCEMLSDPTSSCPLRNFGENVLLRATAGHSREEIGVGGPDRRGVCLHLASSFDFAGVSFFP